MATFVAPLLVVACAVVVFYANDLCCREQMLTICCVQFVGKPLPYDNIQQLRKRMADIAPHLAKNDQVQTPIWLNGEYFKV